MVMVEELQAFFVERTEAANSRQASEAERSSVAAAAE
jgi:hypothetical protein